jgi:hypothetical protein
LQKMLGLHSEIFAGPEFDHLPGLMRLYRQMAGGVESGRQQAFYDHEMLRASLSAFIESLLVRSADDLGKRLVSEKTPDNVLVFEELAAVFPEARFVFVVRDPRAVVHSMREVDARAAAKGQPSMVGHDLLADMEWIDRSTAAGDRFAARRGARCVTIHYEDLVSQPESTARALCAFVGVPFEENMLATELRNEHSQPIIEKDGVWYTPDMYNRSIDASRRGAWVGVLPPSTALVIEHYFARKRYTCHGPYGLRVGSRNTRLRYFAARAARGPRKRLFSVRAAFARRLSQVSAALRMLRSAN